MRHGIAGYKLSRDTEHRTALFRNLAAGLFQHGQITTTLQKAKAVQPFVEKLITLARRGDLHARRQVIARLQDRKLVTVDKDSGDPIYEEHPDGRDKTLVQKLFEEIGPKYADRPGGYTRIVRLGTHRIGDGGDLVVLQLVGDEEGASVAGRSSRRRQKQNNRTTFAAKLRKAGGGAAATEASPADADAEPQAPPPAPAEDAPEGETAAADAPAEAPAEDKPADAPAAEAAADGDTGDDPDKPKGE